MDKLKSLQIILAAVTGFILMYFIFHLRLFLYLALFIGFTSLVSGNAATFIAIAWEWLGEKIGWLVSSIILIVVFLFLCFISLIYRIVKSKGPLDLPAGDSYFRLRNHEFTSSDMEELW